MNRPTMKIRHVATLCVLTVLLWSNVGAAATRVRVGVYDFPPIAQLTDSGKLGGLLGGLLDILNDRQSDYIFEPFLTSAKRRYLDFRDHRYDVIFFEDPDWGWSGNDIQISAPLLADEEVYVALRKPGRDQSFFDNLDAHRVVAMLGYHYGFTRGDISEESLHKRFNIELSRSHRRNLELILADRPSVAEITVVSRSYLALFLRQHPEDRNKLLISDKSDQRYQLRAIAHKTGAITIPTLQTLLQPIMRDGTYQRLVKAHQLTLPADGLPLLP